MVLKILQSPQVVILVSLLEVNAFYIESVLGYLKANGKFIVAVPSEWANESGKQPRFFSQWHLPIPTVHVQFGEHGGSCQLTQNVINLWQGWCSLSTHQLTGLRSMQILTPPFFFTTTMLTHQGAGCGTFDRTP